MDATVRICRPAVVALDQAVPVNARLVSVGELSGDSTVGIENYVRDRQRKFRSDWDTIPGFRDTSTVNSHAAMQYTSLALEVSLSKRSSTETSGLVTIRSDCKVQLSRVEV